MTTSFTCRYVSNKNGEKRDAAKANVKGRATSEVSGTQVLKPQIQTVTKL